MNHPFGPSRLIECLETRIAPAGVVAVSFSNGVLELTGDEVDNELSLIALPGARFVLSAGGETQFQFGERGYLYPFLNFSGALKSISANLLEGDDTLQIAGVTTTGRMNIDMGEGKNSTLLIETQVGGSLAVSGGAGDDTVRFAGPSLGVGGNLKIHTGDGAQTLSFETRRTTIGGALTYEGGSGGDTVRIEGSRTEVNSIHCDFDVGGASFGGGGRMKVNSDVRATTEGGYLEFDFLGPLFVGGDFDFSATADARIFVKVGFLPGARSLDIGGEVKLSGGSGGKTLALLATRANIGGIEVAGGGSQMNKLELWFGSGTIPKGISFAGGNVEDRVSLELKGCTTGPIDCTMGDGAGFADVKLEDSSVGRFQLFGGTSFDRINVFSRNLATTGKFTVDGGGGDDPISIDLRRSSIGGDLLVGAGDEIAGGAAKVAFKARRITTGGDLVVTSEAGANQFTMDTAFATTFGGGIRFEGGPDGEVIEAFFDISSAAFVTLDLGGGADHTVLGIGGPASGPVQYNGGGYLLLFGENIGSAVLNGDDRDLVAEITGSFSNLTVRKTSPAGISQVTLNQATVGRANIETGDGADKVTIVYSVINSLTVHTAGGDDVLALEGQPTDRPRIKPFMGKVSIDMGAGDDTLTIGDAGPGLGAVFGKPVVAAGGLGMDHVLKSDPANVIPGGSIFDFETVS
jgi:hypothetical protein